MLLPHVALALCRLRPTRPRWHGCHNATPTPTHPPHHNHHHQPPAAAVLLVGPAEGAEGHGGAAPHQPGAAHGHRARRLCAAVHHAQGAQTRWAAVQRSCRWPPLATWHCAPSSLLRRRPPRLWPGRRRGAFAFPGNAWAPLRCICPACTPGARAQPVLSLWRAPWTAPQRRQLCNKRPRSSTRERFSLPSFFSEKKKGKENLCHAVLASARVPHGS